MRTGAIITAAGRSSRMGDFKPLLKSLKPDCLIDSELIRAAALLHDIARTEKNHDKAGFKYLLKCGYPRIADIVLSQHPKLKTRTNII